MKTTKQQFNVRLSPELAACIRTYAEMCDLTNDAAITKLTTIGLTAHTTGLLANDITSPWNDQKQGRKMRQAWRTLLATTRGENT